MTTKPVLLLTDAQLSRCTRSLISVDKFSVATGERVLVTGRSGCGKSSFLLALAGMVPEYVDAQLSGSWQLSSSVGLVFQNPWSQMVCPTVEDEIAFALENRGMDVKTIRLRVDSVLESLHMTKLAHRKPWTLSGGECQKVAIAAAIAQEPQLLLLDECLSYLDSQAAEELIELVASLPAQMAIVIVDHQPWRWKAIVRKSYQIDQDGVLKSVPNWQSAPQQAPHHHLASLVQGQTMLELHEVDAVYKRREPGQDEQTGHVNNLVLSKFNLSLKQGQSLAITGPSGSGKTTVLRLLTGVLKPQAGNVNVPKAMIYVPQNPEHFFVYQSAAEEWQGAEDLAQTFGLTALANRHPFTLSEGEKRRLTLCAALSSARKRQQDLVLLLDEPSYGLDAASLNAFVQAIEQLQANGLSMIMVSHDLSLCRRLADQIIDLKIRNQPAVDSQISLKSSRQGICNLGAKINPLALFLVNFFSLMPVMLSLDYYVPVLMTCLSVVTIVVFRPRALSSWLAASSLIVLASFWVFLATAGYGTSQTGQIVQFLWIVKPSSAFDKALVLAMRSAAMAMISFSFVLIVDLAELTRSLMVQWRLSPRFGFALFTALNILPRLRQEQKTIAVVHRMRSGRRLNKLLPQAIALLAGAIRHAERAALSMAQRGLEKQADLGPQRSFLSAKDWSSIDTSTVIVALSLIASSVSILLASGLFRFAW